MSCFQSMYFVLRKDHLSDSTFFFFFYFSDTSTHHVTFELLILISFKEKGDIFPSGRSKISKQGNKQKKICKTLGHASYSKKNCSVLDIFFLLLSPSTVVSVR